MAASSTGLSRPLVSLIWVCYVHNVAPERQRDELRARICRVSALFGLEHLRLELVALEQLVELGAIALRKLRRPGHAAAGDAQDPNQVFALEGSPRLLERRKLRGLLPQR